MSDYTFATVGKRLLGINTGPSNTTKEVHARPSEPQPREKTPAEPAVKAGDYDVEQPGPWTLGRLFSVLYPELIKPTTTPEVEPPKTKTEDVVSPVEPPPTDRPSTSRPTSSDTGVKHGRSNEPDPSHQAGRTTHPGTDGSPTANRPAQDHSGDRQTQSDHPDPTVADEGGAATTDQGPDIPSSDDPGTAPPTPAQPDVQLTHQEQIARLPRLSPRLLGFGFY